MYLYSCNNINPSALHSQNITHFFELFHQTYLGHKFQQRIFPEKKVNPWKFKSISTLHLHLNTFIGPTQPSTGSTFWPHKLQITQLFSNHFTQGKRNISLNSYLVQTLFPPLLLDNTTRIQPVLFQWYNNGTFKRLSKSEDNCFQLWPLNLRLKLSVGFKNDKTVWYCADMYSTSDLSVKK